MLGILGVLGILGKLGTLGVLHLLGIFSLGILGIRCNLGTVGTLRQGRRNKVGSPLRAGKPQGRRVPFQAVDISQNRTQNFTESS